MAKLTPRQKGQARSLRRGLTKTEKALWDRLRAHRIGFHFRRQHPVGMYVLDFYCAEALLCVEIDGDGHAYRPEHDAARDELLGQASIFTLRIPSSEVSKNLDGVVARIYDLCVERSGREPFDDS